MKVERGGFFKTNFGKRGGGSGMGGSPFSVVTYYIFRRVLGLFFLWCTYMLYFRYGVFFVLGLFVLPYLFSYPVGFNRVFLRLFWYMGVCIGWVLSFYFPAFRVELWG